MINIVLFEPKFPANVGNIIRLCANMEAQLHIIKPLPFPWDDKKLVRAGLDYAEFVNVIFHENWEDFTSKYPNVRIFAMTTKGSIHHYKVKYQDNDYLLFGSETSGLPDYIRNSVTQRIRVPMKEYSRSMNLSNTVAVALCEALRQLEFPNCI